MTGVQVNRNPRAGRVSDGTRSAHTQTQRDQQETRERETLRVLFIMLSCLLVPLLESLRPSEDVRERREEGAICAK